MSTAVTVNSTPEDLSGKTSTETAAAHRGFFQAHKAGEGYATRLGMMVVIMSYAAFACHHFFYNWTIVRDLFNSVHLGFLTDWTYTPGYASWFSAVGTFLIAAVGLLGGYYFIYVRRDTAEFLIKTDSELAKVTWPDISPWFKVETKVWGATYVVLIVIALMTLYVAAADSILQQLANLLFYRQ